MTRRAVAVTWAALLSGPVEKGADIHVISLEE
jgi:hypothetical protein